MEQMAGECNPEPAVPSSQSPKSQPRPQEGTSLAPRKQSIPVLRESPTHQNQRAKLDAHLSLSMDRKAPSTSDRSSSPLSSVSPSRKIERLDKLVDAQHAKRLMD